MSTVSLLDIGHRDASKLIGSTQNVRITSFSTPSSFYIQLTSEDKLYRTMESDMLEYYGIVSLYFYCRESSKMKLKEADSPFLDKLTIQNLKPKMNITFKFNNKWVRCVTLENPERVKIIDTGVSLFLLPSYEQAGIYELEHRFLSLPSRALLCGLSDILPISSKGYRWSVRACQLFHEFIKNRILQVYFKRKGISPNTYYVFLTAVAKDDTRVHINTLLCAFDAAMVDVANLHHPIWSSDTPC